MREGVSEAMLLRAARTNPGLLKPWARCRKARFAIAGSGFRALSRVPRCDSAATPGSAGRQAVANGPKRERGALSTVVSRDGLGLRRRDRHRQPELPREVRVRNRRAIRAKCLDGVRGLASLSQLSEDAPEHAGELRRVSGADADEHALLPRQTVEQKVAVGRHVV